MERPLLAEQSIGGDWRPGVTYTLLLSYFALFGIIIGAEGVLWADMVAALRLSKSTFGNAQLVAPLIAVALLLIGGQLSAWAGKKRLTLASLVLLGCSVIALGGAGGVWGLMGGLFLAGAGSGLLETGMNGATLDWEQRTGRNVLNVMHAGFSGGAVLGAFGAGTLLGLEWSYKEVLVLLAVLCGLAFAVTLPVRYPPVDARSVPANDPGATLRLLRRPGLAGLALLSALGIVGESVANLWAVIYLDELGATAFAGGVGFAIFNGSMFAGRLLNAPLLDRLGARISLLISGAGLVLATAGLMAGSSVPLAVAAFALAGLAVAGVVPTVLSVAARLEPGNSGMIAGGIMAAAYAGFIIIPPITGLVADLFSVKAALLSIALSGLAILWLGRGVGQPRA